MIAWALTLVNWLHKHIWWHKLWHIWAFIMLFNIAQGNLAEKLCWVYGSSPNPPVLPPSKVSLYSLYGTELWCSLYIINQFGTFDKKCRQNFKSKHKILDNWSPQNFSYHIRSTFGGDFNVAVGQFKVHQHYL